MHFSVIVMAIYLVVSGALYLFKWQLPNETLLMAVFALVTGVLLLTGEGHPRARNWGMALTGFYIAYSGLRELVSLSYAGQDKVHGLLACAAGVLLLITGPGYQKDKLGFKVLAGYLLLGGLTWLLGIGWSWRPELLAVVAIVAGALILVKK